MRWLTATLLIPVLTTGCITDHRDRDTDYDHGDRVAPHPPVGVVSVTGDRTVYLEWLPNQEPDLQGYRVWASDDPHGPYYSLAFTATHAYTHRGVVNGRTLYYGISAVDMHGNESELNDHIIYDTPRPEGFDLTLFEADGVDSDYSAFDFSRERRTHWESASADVFFDRVGNVAFLAVPDLATDIQDAGYGEFDDVTWAPAGGWAPSGAVEAVPGHVYVIWTRDDNYAKVRVIEVTDLDIVVDWAYQVDRGNPELLAPRPGGLRPRLVAP